MAELGDKGAEALDRVKQAGMDAAEAAREKVKSPQLFIGSESERLR